jgi:hypothetical protein
MNGQLKAIETMASDPDNNWYKYFMSIFKEIDPGIRKKIFENWVVNASIVGLKREQEMSEKYDCNIPWAILYGSDVSLQPEVHRLLGRRIRRQAEHGHRYA